MPVARIYRAATPFNASELAAIDYEQVADVLFMAHENHDPTKLIRNDHADWSYETITFGPTIAAPANVQATKTEGNSVTSGDSYFPQTSSYVVTAYNEDTGQESRASSSDSDTTDLSLKKNYITVTWNAVSGATLYRIYKSQSDSSYGYIGSTDGTSFRDTNIGPDFSDGPPAGDDPFAADGDKPSSVTFHEQRSWWGGTINRPNAIYASKSADYENMDFSRPVRESDAFAIGLVANKVNSVSQLVSTDQGLVAFTSDNIFSVQGSNQDYIAAAPPPRIRREISRGGSRLNPLSVDKVVFYEAAKAGEVRTVGYQFELDGIKSDDLTIFSRHLFEGLNILDWAFAEKPGSIIPAIMSDGTIRCLTWDQAQDVWGWTKWDTPLGTYEGICSIYEDGEDRPYLLVRRTIDGTERLYVERMASDLWEDQEDTCYLDCARTFVNATAVSTLDRLDHLEGCTVYALVDGAVVKADANGDPLVVSNGSISLPVSGLKITVGLPFTALIETLPLAIQTPQGWTLANPQQANNVVLRVKDTRGIEAGPSEASLFDVKFREEEVYGAPTALFSGDKEIDCAGTSQNETVVVVRSADPLPMQINAILVKPDIRGAR